jgi:hypothetical protein
MLSKQKPKFKKVLLLLLSAHEHFSTLHTLTTLAEESLHSKRVCLCGWFPRGPSQERVAEGLLWGRRRGETTRQRQRQSLQRWRSKTGHRQKQRERERERENWAQSNKIKQNFTKVCVCKFFNSRKKKSQKQLRSIDKHPNKNSNYITFISIPKKTRTTTPTRRKTISKRKTGEAKKN